MSELSGDEVGHGDEVFDAAIAARPCARLLEGSIHRFDAAVVFAGVKTVEYARKMLGDRPAEALEGFESAAAGPAEPALEQGLGLVRCRGSGVDGAQRLLDPPGPCGLEVRALQPVVGAGVKPASTSRHKSGASNAVTAACNFGLRAQREGRPARGQRRSVQGLTEDGF